MAKGVFSHSQSSCHIAKVVLTLRHDSRQIPIASDAAPRPTSRGFLPWRFAYAGPGVCRTTIMGPASANLHSNGLMQRSKYSGYSITSGERYCIWGSQLAGSAAGGGERHEDLQEQLKPPNGGVFLGLNGIVIKSHGGSDAEVFADAINLGYKLVLQELHSKIKQTIASAVRRRGHKRRTLWRGVTTKPGQP